jgi:hypothetical protein
MRAKNPLSVLSIILAVLIPGLVAGCSDSPSVEPQMRVMVEGLLNPVGLATLPDGSLLVAEEGTGERDNSAGISLITAGGQTGRFISGMTSSRDSGDLSGAPLVAVSPTADMLYVGHFNDGHLWTYPLDQNEPLSVPDSPLTVDDLQPAMQPLNRVQLINPFDMTFDQNGVPVVSDASANGVAKENPDGTTRFIHQFFDIPDTNNRNLSIQPVPTGITRVGAEYYVTLTGGCPYPPDSGQLVAIDENRNQRTLLTDLNMPIDVAVDENGVVWVLEFARFEPGASCFTGEGYLPNTGRLSRLNADGVLEPVIINLNFPGAVLPLPDGSFYLSEVFAGRVLHINLGSEPENLPLDAAIIAPDAETLTLPSVPRATITPAPPPTPKPETAWQFVDVAASTGLDFRHGAFQEDIYPDPVAMMGAGLCWLDYDNDGWYDLYLVNSHALEERDNLAGQEALPANALYRNRAGVFTNVSQETNSALQLRGNGCVAADFNQDGWTDIYVTADGPNALLWNNGDGTFDEGAADAGVDAADWNSAAAVGDLNGDGWPDLFVASYLDLERKIPNPSGAFPQDYYGLADYLYINNGPDAETGRATFSEVANAAGLVREERGLGALFSDFDGDGDLDLYIANDGHPNRVYQHEPWPEGQTSDPAGLGFRFTDLTDTAGAGDSGSGMGVAGGDYDGDGLLDLLVTNWDTELNALYQNQTTEDGALNFRYRTYSMGMSGLGRNLTGWGTAWADLDHDTDSDLLVVNGHVPITDLQADRQLVHLYGNRTAEGDPGNFRDWTEKVGLTAVGPLLARGSALADFDNDGDLDVAINTIAGPAALLRNEGPKANWLLIDIQGYYPGTMVTVILPDGRRLVREWQTGSSYLASEDPRLHFGLADVVTIPRMEVRWPDGEIFTFENIPVNQVISIVRQ